MNKKIYNYFYGLCNLYILGLSIYEVIRQISMKAWIGTIAWGVIFLTGIFLLFISIRTKKNIRLCASRKLYGQIINLILAICLIVFPGINIGFKLLVYGFLLSGIIYLFETKFYKRKDIEREF